MILEILSHSFAYEAECVVRLFFPGIKLEICREPSGAAEDVISTRIEEAEGRVRMEASACVGDFCESLNEEHPASLPEQERERLLCILLFRLLCRATGQTPPWGVLTGVRPVRLVHPLLEQGKTADEIAALFEQRYLTRPEKTRLAVATAIAEGGILRRNRPEAFSLYVGIPFCPTRCLYCSFVSHAVEKAAGLIPDYVEKLREELRRTGEIAREKGLLLQSVYIGGGTPTSLSPEQLAAVMGALRESFDLSHLLEYTVEAGRPDTLTCPEGRERLAVLREYGAGRVSVNPQSMDDGVLNRIGRLHTAAQTVEAFHMAREAGFSCINMDLIAGLPGETPEGFLRGLDQVLSLEPENVTVHTLTVKRSSALRGREDAFDDAPYDLSALLDEGRGRLAERGLHPYYLYRQKGTRQNLENVGYSRPGWESYYNVYSMEEVHTVLACGAGGVTKLCAPGNRVRRVFNFKYPAEYISRHGELMERKTEIRSWREKSR